MPEVPLLAPTPWPVVVYDVDPSQPIDEPLYFRGPWYRTLFRDIKIVLRNAPEIPYTLIPLPTLGAAADPNNPKDITTWGFIFEVVATIVSLVITVAFIPAFLVGMVLALVILFVFLRFNVRLQGADIRLSDPADGDKPFANEAWLFVNGIATTGSGVQLTVDFLRGLFGRQVMGICNRSQGVWFDLIECVLQRDLLWPTSDVNRGYGRLCDAIRNEGLERVVLIAHSQGGIIAAAWMVRLAEQKLAVVDPLTGPTSCRLPEWRIGKARNLHIRVGRYPLQRSERRVPVVALWSDRAFCEFQRLRSGHRCSCLCSRRDQGGLASGRRRARGQRTICRPHFQAYWAYRSPAPDALPQTRRFVPSASRRRREEQARDLPRWRKSHSMSLSKFYCG